MFRSFQNGTNKGFQMIFENGLEISVQWGAVNYCSNRQHRTPKLDCENAEVAVFKKNKAVTIEVLGCQEIGYSTPDEVAKYIAIVAAHNGVI